MPAFPTRFVPSSRRLADAFRRVGDGFLGLLYPERCLACDARAPGGDPLCPSCLAGLERARPEAVREQLARLPVSGGAAEAGSFETVLALWRFDPDGALRALQHAIKYRNRPRYGRAAGRWIGEALATALPPAVRRDGAVVPVPLHHTRLLERGYNQSEALARGLAERLGVPCRPDWLARPRPTRSQTRLSRRARWQNVADAFSAPHALGGQPIIVVDDVLTTGATAAAAARVLHHAGAGFLHLATLALTA